MSEVPRKAIRRLVGTRKHGAGRSRRWARLSIQGYLAHRKPRQPHPPLDRTVATCLGPCGSPRSLALKVPLSRCKGKGRQRPRLAALPHLVGHPPCEDEDERHDGLPQGAFLSDGKGFQFRVLVSAPSQCIGSQEWRRIGPRWAPSVLYTGAPRSVQGRHAHAKSPPKGPKGAPL